MAEPDKLQMTIEHGACALHDDKKGYRHTLRINAYYFSTATVVMRTRLHATLTRTLPTLFVLIDKCLNVY